LHTLNIKYTLEQGAHHTTSGSGGYTTNVQDGGLSKKK